MGESDVRQQDSRARRAIAPLPDLVVSKVRSPLLRPGTVRRSSLIARLAQGDRRPVISVVAPPGTFVLAPSGVEHGFRNDGAVPVRMLNIHAPAGFDRRIGLEG